jgi:hypothetical protein
MRVGFAGRELDMSKSRKALTKIFVDLPHHWATGGESMWALPLGADLFELRNTPFYAYDLNFLDVVKAVPASPEEKPSVLAIARRGGHQTLRVFFKEGIEEPERVQVLDDLRRFGVSYEGCSPRYFSLDVAPKGDVAGLRAHLEELEDTLAYETCEARSPGSFDDLPPKRAASKKKAAKKATKQAPAGKKPIEKKKPAKKAARKAGSRR